MPKGTEVPYKEGFTITVAQNKILIAGKETVAKVCHRLAELTFTSTDGGFHGRRIKEQLFRRGCDSDFLSRPKISKILQCGWSVPP